MICKKCGSEEFVSVNLPDNTKNTTIVISSNKDVHTNISDKSITNISVCKKCGDIISLTN
jgi:DNA-directed RNA polymerase subunit M/transcription elongation factor TFIIS